MKRETQTSKTNRGDGMSNRTAAVISINFAQKWANPDTEIVEISTDIPASADQIIFPPEQVALLIAAARAKRLGEDRPGRPCLLMGKDQRFSPNLALPSDGWYTTSLDELNDGWQANLAVPEWAMVPPGKNIEDATLCFTLDGAMAMGGADMLSLPGVVSLDSFDDFGLVGRDAADLAVATAQIETIHYERRVATLVAIGGKEVAA